MTAHQIDGRLHIKVQDDGSGGHTDGQGVGLSLLKERLAALYEGDARLDVQASAGGVCATLDVPARFTGGNACPR